MSFRNKSSIFTVITMLAFLSSLVITTPAYADDETPTAESPLVAEPAGSPDQEPLPEDTGIVVLNEEGQPLPLATQAAADIIANGDPQWCPVGVTPNSATCTPNRTSLSDTISDLYAMNAGTGPNKAGVIWIHENYNSSTATGTVTDVGVTEFTLEGLNLTTMKNFALTIQGGWTGTGKTINAANPSDFVGASLRIFKWNNAVTVNNISINSSGSGGPGLYISTTGN